MQICFHIGPHKTGTTSIQAYLLRSIGSADPVERWYPYTKPSEPGHAEYARDWLFRDARMFRDLIARAERAGVRQMIVSAEDFDNLYDKNQDVLSELLRPFDVHLIITMNSLIGRAASSWQEAVKHGYPHALADASKLIFNMPGYRPDFVDVARQVVRPARTSIIVAARDQSPVKLIGDFCLTLGQPVPSPGQPVPRSNVRLHWSEAEQMRMMNQKVRELGLPPENRKAIRKTMLQGLLKARDKAFSYRRIETPDAMKPSLREAAAAMKASIARQVDEGAVSVIGDLDALSSEP